MLSEALDGGAKAKPHGIGSEPLAAWRLLRQPCASMLLLASAILFVGLDQGQIRIDGPIYAWAAKHMIVSGDWLNLYYDHGQTPYFNKPPLQFWLMALVFKAIGYSTFSAKLVSVLFGVACIAMVYAIARLRFEPALSATAGIVLATTYTFVRNTAAVRLDAGVTFFFLVALYTGARMLLSREPHLAHWVTLGAACGLALMLKSGVALLCLPILIGAFAWNRRWDLLRNWRTLVAFAVCAVIVLPWYWHQYHTWGQAFIDQHFRNQMLGRFESGTFGASPWYAYISNLTLHYWWFPLALFGAYKIARQPASLDEHHRSWDRLHIAWTLGSLVILHLLPRKYDRYLLLVYPGLAIVVAYGLYRTRVWEKWKTSVLPNLGWIALVVGLGLQISGVRLHSTAYPELARALPTINRAPGGAVYVIGTVPIAIQCSIRFYSDSKALTIDHTEVQTLKPGDILVAPRKRPADFSLPSHRTIAEGRNVSFVVINGQTSP